MATKRPLVSRWLVSANCMLCIEGFPRSANSFAYTALLQAQNDPSAFRCATHTHSPAQVLQAVRLGVPTMLCVRKPKDAVCALVAFDRQIALRKGETILPPTGKEVGLAAKRWEAFYRQTLPVKDQVYIALFERIISDYSAVSQEFIERFNLQICPYDPLLVPAQNITSMSFHMGPSKQREQLKIEVLQVIKASESEPIWRACDDLYRKFVSQ